MDNPNRVGSNRYKAWEEGYYAAQLHSLSEADKMELWMDGYDMKLLNTCVINPMLLEDYSKDYSDKLLFKEFKRGMKAYVKTKLEDTQCQLDQNMGPTGFYPEQSSPTKHP